MIKPYFHIKDLCPFIPLLMLVSCWSEIHAQTPPQPVKETILLMEDFDHSSGVVWPEKNYGDTAIAKIENGNYVMDSKNASRFWALRLSMPAGLSASPTILEMKMKITPDSPRADYGILWHTIQKARNIFDEYCFLVSSDGKFLIGIKEYGVPHYLQDWTDCSCIYRKDYNVLRIEQSGDQLFSFFVNDQLVYKVPLTNAGFTTLGFYAEGHTILNIDYIKLATQDLTH